MISISNNNPQGDSREHLSQERPMPKDQQIQAESDGTDNNSDKSNENAQEQTETKKK